MHKDNTEEEAEAAKALRAIGHLQKGEDLSATGEALGSDESDGDDLDILKEAGSDGGDVPFDCSYEPDDEARKGLRGTSTFAPPREAGDRSGSGDLGMVAEAGPPVTTAEPHGGPAASPPGAPDQELAPK